jgi:hypothetical protein
MAEPAERLERAARLRRDEQDGHGETERRRHDRDDADPDGPEHPVAYAEPGDRAGDDPGHEPADRRAAKRRGEGVHEEDGARVIAGRGVCHSPDCGGSGHPAEPIDCRAC